MPKYKKPVSRLKDPSRFQGYHAEEKYKEIIESCKILEKKGFQSPPQPSGITKTHYVAIVRRGWQGFCKHPRDRVLPLVKEFYANMLGQSQQNIWVRNSLVPLDLRVVNAFYNFPLMWNANTPTNW